MTDGVEGKGIMSIPSILIRTCMTNIQKELSQLEHWLNTLPTDIAPRPDTLLEKLSKQYEVQQHAMNHLVDRLEILEASKGASEDVWLDSSSTYLENAIIDPLNEAEPVYVVRKEEEALSVLANVSPVESKNVVVQPDAALEPVQEIVVPPVVEEPVAPVASVALVEEEEPVEEEEDGVELVEVTYKGITYYKDSAEGFIYAMDEEGQPSEQPIGVWKEKSKSVAFYRT